MEQVVITDANIFIDLFKIDLILLLFQLDLEIHTTREILDELHDYQRAAVLQNEGLVVHDLTEQQWQQISALALNRGFSDADRSVLGLAYLLGIMLLTNENLMRRKAEAWGLEIHGTLWLLDCFLERALLHADDALEKLQQLMQLNIYLPMKECNERLELWKRKN